MLTKAEKAHDTKTFRAAREIAARIAELPNSVTDEQVLNAMQSQKCSKRVLADAFWVMDNEPSRFANHQVWHPRLRSLRNNPDVGERMFALFQ